jgi:hypothetical protein
MGATQTASPIQQGSSNDLPMSMRTRISRRGGVRRNVSGRLDQPLRCMWTGYPTDGCTCHARIPKAIVTAAWRDELEGSDQSDRFFHFVWHDGVWLGYGLKDGRVGGVCCPTHIAQRARVIDPYADEPVLAPAA